MDFIRCITVMGLLIGAVSACSRQNPAVDESVPAKASTSAASVSSASASVAASTVPADNACNLLTDAEVRGVFPQATAGKRNIDSLQYGLDRCAWQEPTGQIGVEVSKIEASAFENELRGDLTGFVDPRINGAIDNIHFQNIPGIGDKAIAVLEKADAKRGIYTDIALLAIQRGHRMAVLMARDVSPDAPLPTRESLVELGRKLASRL
jgi:hypothetical protein